MAPLDTVQINRLRRAHEAARALEIRRDWSSNYPSNPMIDERFKLPGAAKRALEAYRDERPFALAPEPFVEASRRMLDLVSEAYAMPAPLLTAGRTFGSEQDSGASNYQRGRHLIELMGRKSVMTLLHEFGHARGFGETGAVWWSVNVFRRVWPRSFARLVNPPGTHLMVRGGQ